MKITCPHCGGAGEIEPPTAAGERLAMYRHRSKMKLEEAAFRASISLSTLWRYEAGITQRVPVGALARLAAVYNVSLDELVRGAA